MKKLFALLLCSSAILSFSYAKNSKNLPVIEESDKGRMLVLPEGLDAYLANEFSGYRIPQESEFNPEMLKYYFSRLVGIHPAVAWGDFNNDKRQDYALLIMTGESKLGPLIELVVLNGEKKRDDYMLYRLSEVYNFKDDYISFDDGKLYKGKFKKNGWRINWNPKKKTYDVDKY